MMKGLKNSDIFKLANRQEIPFLYQKEFKKIIEEEKIYRYLFASKLRLYKCNDFIILFFYKPDIQCQVKECSG